MIEQTILCFFEVITTRGDVESGAIQVEMEVMETDAISRVMS